jgi:hypothetical protein
MTINTFRRTELLFYFDMLSTANKYKVKLLSINGINDLKATKHFKQKTPLPNTP